MLFHPSNEHHLDRKSPPANTHCSRTESHQKKNLSKQKGARLQITATTKAKSKLSKEEKQEFASNPRKEREVTLLPATTSLLSCRPTHGSPCCFPSPSTIPQAEQRAFSACHHSSLTFSKLLPLPPLHADSRISPWTRTTALSPSHPSQNTMVGAFWWASNPQGLRALFPCMKRG